MFTYFRQRKPVVVLAVVVGLLSACTSPSRQHLGDRAFIQYWTPPVGAEGKMRVAVKDIIDLRGEVTTVGSEYFTKWGQPAKQDADCLNYLRQEHVCLVGKTNLNELALGTSGVNEYFGTPKNSLDQGIGLMPGGSSSGCAVAVADDRADIAIGTDTAGSIRTPAACCGVCGLKTTFGLVSLKGVYPLSPKHLDTVGPMAKDIPRLVEGMELLKPGFSREYEKAVAATPESPRIVIGRLRIPGTDPTIDRAVDDALKAADFAVVPLSPGLTAAWLEAEKHGRILAVTDGYASNKHLLAKKGITPTTKAAILLGRLERGSKIYQEALKRRPAWQAMLDRTFQTVDFIALPTLKHQPYKIPWIGRHALFEAKALALQNTTAVNYAGNPALAIPVPLKGERMPVTSLQLIGPLRSEASLLNAGRIVVESAAASITARSR
ncbi:amidase [Roseimicrobium sp. ORNL1]|uniref:amidase n=1 Tax=Roseimicrobium sp. ORNL1 TaxID=2711231 RepID=UPI0013E133D2|nr:amidase [Roseimicrobium sp. ORNL1]QIF02852.1 amidase [Roseimicrobium sp. ORNL1]